MPTGQEISTGLIGAGSFAILFTAVRLAWKIMTGAQESSERFGTYLETRYQDRLSQQDTEIAALRERVDIAVDRAEACEEREAQLRVLLVAAGVIPPGLPPT